MAPLPTEPFGLQQSMPSTIGHNDHIPMWFVSHVIQILTMRLWLSLKRWQICTKRYARKFLNQALQLLHHWFRFSKPIGKRCRFCHATEHRAHMHVSSSDHCETTILSTVSNLAKRQINEECLLCNVESWESLSLADTSNLVFGTALVADSAVLRLPGSCCLFQLRAEMSRALNNFSNRSTCASSMSCQSCHLMRRSCSNPVHIDHQ